MANEQTIARENRLGDSAEKARREKNPIIGRFLSRYFFIFLHFSLWTDRFIFISRYMYSLEFSLIFSLDVHSDVSVTRPLSDDLDPSAVRPQRFNDARTFPSYAVKPECYIEKERFEGQDYAVCSAIANPKETDFVWSLKSDNDTLEQVAEMRNGRSYMLLDTSVTNFRTYVCVANNSIGHSAACERDIPGWCSKEIFHIASLTSFPRLEKKEGRNF